MLPSSRVLGVCPGGEWLWMKLIPALSCATGEASCLIRTLLLYSTPLWFIGDTGQPVGFLHRVTTNLENMENLENSGNLKNSLNLRENSGKYGFL